MDEQTVSTKSAQPQLGQPAKKPYTTPQVVVHGTVAELTRLKGGQNPDNETASFVPTVN